MPVMLGQVNNPGPKIAAHAGPVLVLLAPPRSTGNMVSNSN
ncbi:MAG: hypothetical protein ACKOPG_08255 [Novosphingobium sp.]